VSNYNGHDDGVPHQQQSRLLIFDNRLPIAERIGLRMIRLVSDVPSNRSSLLSVDNVSTSSSVSSTCPADTFSSTTLMSTGRGQIFVTGSGTRTQNCRCNDLIVCPTFKTNLVARGKVGTDRTKFRERRMAVDLNDLPNAFNRTMLPADLKEFLPRL